MDALPIPISTPGFDVAPYLTSSCVITKDPETGIQNMGTYRGGLKASDRLGVMMSVAVKAGGEVQPVDLKDAIVENAANCLEGQDINWLVMASSYIGVRGVFGRDNPIVSTIVLSEPAKPGSDRG